MEAKESKIIDILTENKKYNIPRYQRPYSWTTEHALQLVEDICLSFEEHDDEYFIGSMICINTSNSSYDIVDGQQRLTTLTLVLCALREVIEDKNIKNDLEERILLIDPYDENENDIPRLSVRDKEFNVYHKFILKGDNAYEPRDPSYTEALFIENYRAILNFLNEYPKEYYKGLTKFILHNVFIVFVQTDSIASSFRLFNVLNNRGMALNYGDLLKNHLFEKAESLGNSAVVEVDTTWQKFEETIGIELIDKFLTIHRISEKKDRDRALSKLYEGYKLMLEKEYGGNPVQLTRVLFQSAENYNAIISNDFKNNEIRKILFTFSQLSNDEWLPPILAYLNRVKHKRDLQGSDFNTFLKLYEKIYLKGLFKKQTKSQREMVCYSALVAINNGYSAPMILEEIKKHDDIKGFIKSLDQDFYEKKPTVVNFIRAVLLRLDQEMQDSSVEKNYTGRITIEHILPQTIKGRSYWEDKYDMSQHYDWVNKLGNLTLISGSKNSEASNRDFPAKKKVYDKLNQRVSFDITKEVMNYNEWALEDLKKRHLDLKNRLINLFG